MWTLEDYQFSEFIQKCAADGVAKAKEAAKNAGIPIAYALNGKLIFQLADGSVTDDIEMVNKIYDQLAIDLKIENWIYSKTTQNPSN